MSDSENNDDDYAVSGSDGDEDPSTTYNPHKTETQTPKAARGRRGAAAKVVPKRSTPKRTMAKRAVKRMRMKPETSDDSDDDYAVSPPPKKKDGRKKGKKTESPQAKSKKSPAAKDTKAKPAVKATKSKLVATPKVTKRRKSQVEENYVDDAQEDADNGKKEELGEEESSSPKEKTVIPNGDGIKLGDIEKVDWNIEKFKLDELKILHEILFNKKGSNSEVKSNIKLFNGFDFKKDSPEYEKKKAYLNKLKSAALKICCVIVRIEHSGSKGDLAARLLDYLMNPNDHVKGATPKAKTKKDAAAAAAANKEKSPPSNVPGSPTDAPTTPAENNDALTKTTARPLAENENADPEVDKAVPPSKSADTSAKVAAEPVKTPDNLTEAQSPATDAPIKE